MIVNAERASVPKVGISSMADSRERPVCGVVSLIGKAAVLKIASRAQACVGSSPSHFANAKVAQSVELHSVKGYAVECPWSWVRVPPLARMEGCATLQSNHENEQRSVTAGKRPAHGPIVKRLRRWPFKPETVSSILPGVTRGSARYKGRG